MCWWGVPDLDAFEEEEEEEKVIVGRFPSRLRLPSFVALPILVAIALVTGSCIGKTGAGTGSGSPASARPSVSPVIALAAESPDETLSPGRWETSFHPPFSFETDGSWQRWNDSSDFLDLHLLGAGGGQIDGDLYAFGLTKVFDGTESPSPRATMPVPDDLMGYVTSLPGLREVAPVRPATIGGLPATRVDVEGTGRDCVVEGNGPTCWVQFGSLGKGDPRVGIIARSRTRIYVLEVDGVHVMILYSDTVRGFGTDVEKAEALLRTVRFS